MSGQRKDSNQFSCTGYCRLRSKSRDRRDFSATEAQLSYDNTRGPGVEHGGVLGVEFLDLEARDAGLGSRHRRRGEALEPGAHVHRQRSMTSR